MSALQSDGVKVGAKIKIRNYENTKICMEIVKHVNLIEKIPMLRRFMEVTRLVFSKLCAMEDWQVCREFFKVLYVDTKFLPKLRKCCYEVIVDICRKWWVTLQVTLIEVMTFLKIILEIAPFRAASCHFQRSLPREMVISEKKVITILAPPPAMPLEINRNRFQWLVCSEICSLISCAGGQKSQETTGLDEHNLVI